MECPEWIKVGETTYHFSKCNNYQKAVYTELVRHLNARMQLKSDVEKNKKDGVIEYLCQKLDLYGSLKKIRNIYSDEELTK